jgi:hypothetical protein
MNYGIQYLCYLVQKKNDLNRKRRRYYYAINPGLRKQYIPNARVENTGDFELNSSECNVFVYVPRRRKRGSVTKRQAKKLYKQTQKEMKSMTPEMRKVRKEINARLVWSAHGAIKGIYVGDNEYYDYAVVARYSDLWEADAILLGD